MGDDKPTITDDLIRGAAKAARDARTKGEKKSKFEALHTLVWRTVRPSLVERIWTREWPNREDKHHDGFVEGHVEVLQEAFVRLYEHLLPLVNDGRLEGMEAVITYLNEEAAHFFIEARRQTWRDRKKPRPRRGARTRSQDPGEPGGRRASPPMEEVRQLEAILKRLSQRDRDLWLCAARGGTSRICACQRAYLRFRLRSYSAASKAVYRAKQAARVDSPGDYFKLLRGIVRGTAFDKVRQRLDALYTFCGPAPHICPA